MYVQVKMSMSYFQEVKAWHNLTVCCPKIQSAIHHSHKSVKENASYPDFDRDPLLENDPGVLLHKLKHISCHCCSELGKSARSAVPGSLPETR